MKVKSESEVAQSRPTLATPWTAAHQAPLSMGFFRLVVDIFNISFFAVAQKISLVYDLLQHIYCFGTVAALFVVPF